MPISADGGDAGTAPSPGAGTGLDAPEDPLPVLRDGDTMATDRAPCAVTGGARSLAGPKEVAMTVRYRLVALGAGVGLCLPLLAVVGASAPPAVAEVPPDQARTVVFELFTAPVTASGGG